MTPSLELTRAISPRVSVHLGPSLLGVGRGARWVPHTCTRLTERMSWRKAKWVINFVEGDKATKPSPSMEGSDGSFLCSVCMSFVS
ncbi:hypothetical protein HPP92_015674 [Vanilla planifolia]|uniref:Uncharacterized protein n=1 Tax=Vanilla planifolia TaxID=51239 RepID=A0A835QU14_VANPL|nr:hypothetical protein HPP92_015674 [Vanilla planifolia]